MTRRTLFSGAAVAGAISAVAPEALAAVAEDRRAVWTRTIGVLSGGSAPIRSSRRFSLVGIQWSEPGVARIELRAQAPEGRWSPWVTASTLGHDGDGQPTGGVRFGEPLWTGPTSAVELRSDRRVTGVRVNFVSAPRASGTGFAAAPRLAEPVLDAGPGQPPIIARRAWAQGLAHPRRVAGYGSVKLGFVHHTVNPNGYAAAEVPAMLRAIFDYHVAVRGWWDIGYNFVIDLYGRIWEARAGGIDMAVVGAQAGAYNTESTGVAMLGDFMNAAPPPAALAALEQLLAWKLSLHGIPSTGRVTVVVDPADAFYTRFRPGAHVSLPRVAGHRDGDLTDCPGNALYSTLPSLRPRIASLAGTPARLAIGAPPTPLTAGAPAT
ncbi:MAG: N-acetylmuramoyl-L-alanine amidase, partial [Solirubrobacterales bacterium]|nr:N-acetylmuramoyl-L-alanine amidase [Solirubrobacterales bacterium]